MTAFEKLHPALQHHIVNSLEWRSLRPFQERCIETILAGNHAIVLAPTAGGKTEAASFPILSRMLSEDWSGLSVLYVCPIRALLNNLIDRLRKYCELVGRTAGVWHGDTSQSEKRRMLAEPPDLLLTTPESIEVLLVSRKTEHASLFANTKAVVVDEIHAFAGDDRGWHLLSVLERVSKLAGGGLQRIGLSATVGNPAKLLSWLTNSSKGLRELILPEASTQDDAEVQLDYVGSLGNAATVISRLHRGQKRLVFCDSRSRVEELANMLRQIGVGTYVSHSSLSADERHRAESAFAAGNDCVIVATSALELGIDVGDLDRVIQIDSPPTVSSFLQRMGRTGRRSGAKRNCLFLATSSESLIQAAGLIRLWESGFVEPVEPPQRPLHILAQQIMALALQESGIGNTTWRDWIGSMPGFADLDPDDIAAVLRHMVQEKILWDEDGILWFGKEGEKKFGRKNFMELLSVFTSPPMFTVRCGRSEIGVVHQLSLMTRADGPVVLSLGGRNWGVSHVDWRKHIVFVEPTTTKGRSRWLGGGEPLSVSLCQAIKSVLAGDSLDECWSVRSKEKLEEIRDEFGWLDDVSTHIVTDLDGVTRWWTFAGYLANSSIANTLITQFGIKARCDDFVITMMMTEVPQEIQTRIYSISDCIEPDVSEEAVAELKFVECLPKRLAEQLVMSRCMDCKGVKVALKAPQCHVRLQ